MSGPPPAVAAVRAAVRHALPAEGTVLVACSGGADSLALAAALAFVGPRAGHPVGLVTVDHQLQAGSDIRARSLAEWAEGFFDPVRVATVTVAAVGGPEAAARTARYAALDAVAAEVGATAVLLGHTLDDQAETVLLALARGSGPRGLSGMPATRGIYRRPLLELPRALVRQMCVDVGLKPWEDPHNFDDRYARARVRELITTLGEGVVANLARTAALLAVDCAELDAQADALFPSVVVPAVDGLGGVAPSALCVDELTRLPTALRTRVLHMWARSVGVSGSALARGHISAVDSLVTQWRGQGPIHLPGGWGVRRVAGRIEAVAGAGRPSRATR